MRYQLVRQIIPIFIISILIAAFPASADIVVGAAPEGDVKAVASKIIKYNFPTCRKISKAVRMPDGSIRAKCDGNQYLVFTVFNAKEAKTQEVAVNCTAAKSLLNVSC